MDLLCSPTLIESGIVDAVWCGGWRQPKMENFNFHGPAASIEIDQTTIVLPHTAVVLVHIHQFDNAMAALPSDGHYIVIFREGDPSLTPQKVASLPKCVHHVFSINVIESHPLVTPMPMAFHMHLRCASLATEFAKVEKTNSNTVYAAFSVEGYRNYPDHERNSCVRHFKDKAWATVPDALKQGEWVTTPVKEEEYLKQVRAHRYLAAPMGYGVERIAYWEAMVLGTIPICRKHKELLHFSDMPIAFVNDWSEVTPQWCEDNLHLINRSIDKLRTGYWVDRINEKKLSISR
jgi:hypothetical protein